MTVVTIAEAREHLPDLIRRAAAGEQIVIADNGTWLASLGAAPQVAPGMDETERQRVLDEFERNIARWHAEDGLPYPPESLPQGRPLPESPAA
ncbi:hypothetical protein GobsT_75160 [Gemmata obscuriglobus]|uniref:Type II toxin-antitoxin system prevent-host-death family antitoxin n=1 Tax=Gemmata obscuriglobus TaxID=114 RepID=A0A2Z3HCH5_9BACT|nr:type II toxin-antitoxin system prevent-host-death family antitoxin [Gemmata obscuriglobus]AWM41436.1 type II toxin-antitoxin system prevent-host-death family antitoxin [Gemmata obscuriglobus]QEG32658.1 hypothetical protein GobsT_75160 [Gemmata obscuriglobus]VTS12014.1 : RelB_N [Gemmata obscuriglobus UQM 2246]